MPATRSSRRSSRALLVGFLWRFEPSVWHRARSVLLFFLALVVSAVAIRIAADRTLWAFAVPTAATVLLIGILLGNSAGAAMAGGLAVLAGVMNRDAFEPAVYVAAGGMAALLMITRAERLNAFVRVFGAPVHHEPGGGHGVRAARTTRPGGDDPARRH